MFPTEEDLRGRLLVPYLQALGISPDQLEFEKVFHFKVGRISLRVDSVSRAAVRNRLDILVHNQAGENLFVVELKAEDEPLTEDDRDQGVSYARQLDQVAPFVLVTNGRDARLYDSITKERLEEASFPQESAFWSSGRNLSTADDVRIRYEALRHFIGYSAQNVGVFSLAQQASRTAAIRGSAADPTKKFIPELYVMRREFRASLEAFVAGQGTVFAVVGEPGVGKTNEMCVAAAEIGLRHLALFFAGGTLISTIADTLADEFNWHFSDQIGAPALLQRLADLARRTERRVVIFVDAIDEATVAGFEQSTSDLAARLKAYDGHVKLVLSAKIAEWGRFATVRGDSSSLQLALESLPSTMEAERRGKLQSARGQPFLLARLNEKEYAETLPKYVEFYALPEGPRGKLREYCHVPFLLRVVGETYNGKTAPLPADISEDELLLGLLDSRLRRTTSPQATLTALHAVAECLCDSLRKPEGQTQSDWVAEVEAMKHPAINGRSSTLEELVAQGLLQPQVDAFGRSHVSFYYTRLRDYMIARHALKLGTLVALSRRTRPVSLMA